MSRKKEIEVVEVQWEQSTFHPENDRVVRKYHQFFYCFGANLLLFCFGVIFPQSGFLLPQLEDPDIGFGIDKNQGSWFASIMMFGCLTGSIVGGWQCGHFGRRLSMIIDCFGCFSGLLLLTLSPNFYLALLARFILGHAGASGIVSVPIYVGEISQPQLRDLTSSFTVVCFACGSSIILIIGAAFPWRIAVGISSLVPLVSILILFFCPESPVWLMTKERENEAKNSLEKLRGPDNVDIVEAEFNRIKMNIKAEAKEDEVTEKKNILNTLFDPSFLKPFSLLLLVFCINLEWCGVAAVAFYMVPVLEAANIPLDPYYGAAMLVTIRAFLAIFGSSIVGSRFKKRNALICLDLMMATGTSILATYSYLNIDGELIKVFPYARWVPIMAILLMYLAFACGIGSIPYALQAELLPVHVRSFGSGLLGVIDNLSLFTATKTAPALNELIGIHGSFYFYTGITVACAIILYLTLPDTTGMSLEEIEDMFRPSHKKKLSQ